MKHKHHMVGKCMYPYKHQGKCLSAAGVSQQIQPCLIQPKVLYSQKEALKCPGEEAVFQLAMSKYSIMYYVFLTRVCMRSMRLHPSTACTLMDATVKPVFNGNGWHCRSGQDTAQRQKEQRERRRIHPKAPGSHHCEFITAWTRHLFTRLRRRTASL